jgi:branched-chain amino acid transport system ATP-binding protein
MSELTLKQVCVDRAGGRVVTDVSLTVRRGEVTTLIGPNGAGKTSLLEAISGLVDVAQGSITCDGHEITRHGKVGRRGLGIVHVEQGRTVFGSLTVTENLRVATRSAVDIERAFELFPELRKRHDSAATLLSGGEQQMLVLARALVTRPRFLLVDEMSLGLAPSVFRRLLPLVKDFAADGMGVLLVEQFAQLALGISTEAAVITGGRLTYQGPASVLLEDPERLQRTYMGTDH